MTQAFNLSQLANNLNTSGQLDATDGLSGAVPIANGGTGQTTAANAINALLPSQSGNSGKFLTTNGSSPSWASLPSAGRVIQLLQTVNNTRYSIGATGDTQLTNMSITITPTASNSKILIQFVAAFGTSGGSTIALMLFRDSTNITTITGASYNGMAGGVLSGSTAFPAGGISYIDTPGTTSAITYTIHTSNDGTVFVGGRGDNQLSIAQSMQVWEITQ